MLPALHPIFAVAATSLLQLMGLQRDQLQTQSHRELMGSALCAPILPTAVVHDTITAVVAATHYAVYLTPVIATPPKEIFLGRSKYGTVPFWFIKHG